MADDRGRARGRMPAEPARRPADSGPQLQGAWAARAAAGQAQAAAVARQAQAPAAAAGAGEASGRPGRMEAVQRLEQANPTGGIAAGRGRGRGRRNEPEKRIVTLPEGFIKHNAQEARPLNNAVYANYFEVTNAPDIMLYQYHVDFIPVLDDVRLQKTLFRVHGNNIGKHIFNGTELFTPARLPQPYEVTSIRNSDQTPIRINVRLIKEIHPGDDAYNQVINIIMRKCLALLDLVEVRRDFYDKQAAVVVFTRQREKVEVWPGYLTTIRLHEKKMLLNVDVLSKVMRKDTVADEMIFHRETCGGDWEAVLREKLISLVVMTVYNDRTYRIDDIDFDKNAKSTFFLRKENRDVSYVEYYRTRYDRRVDNPDLPLLVSRPTRRDRNRGDTDMVYLVPSLCVMTGITNDMRKNFNLMKDIVGATRQDPGQRVTTLQKFMQRVKSNQTIAEELRSWGLNFSNQLVTVQPPLRLFQQAIVQGDGKYPVSADKSDWLVQCRSRKMAKADGLANWLVICPPKVNDLPFFVSKLIQTGASMGFTIQQPKIVTMNGDRPNDYNRALDECSSRDYNMVMVVFFNKNNSAEKYLVVKQKTCVTLGIPSQVVTAQLWANQNKNTMAVATKVMMQMAAKCGSEPWRWEVPKQNWMVCGYDTYHDKSQRRAVGAFVASINATFSRYMSCVQLHENNEEISTSFATYMAKALKKWYDLFKRLPDKIFVYRDGIGSGDIERVKDVEVLSAKEAIQNAAMALKMPKPPTLSYIIVSKRINTRFFMADGQRYVNPPAGFKVDTTVTIPERFDFFIVSQSVNQGTVSPTSYHVIDNSTRTSPEIHQRLAYGLTHLYYNWTGTLSVPAPCQYAHKLAYLVGETRIQGEIHDKLSSLPYYL